ncbi:hypothetical protein A2W13_02635 [Candidatus Woesebacteria bacterium RBG_16_36_11]|uniref:Uncharacterized protein n=1 Tax=Candidatus Woesebacteria bacterium RBG_16_36_11 TaxID=1802481 RepID=A0A1F7XAA8_9BACT|nr:MAG: hypothetical protein A2W13_02635 [Candidatus Woesebacteria bacterium RBG_16_36_11]
MLLDIEKVIQGPESSLNLNPETFFKIYKPLRDFDNVTSATHEIVVNEFNKIFGTKYLPIDVRYWNVVRDWAMEKGLNKRDAEEIETHLWFNPDFLFKAKPIPGACELSYWLYEKGLNFPIITSRKDVYVPYHNRFNTVKEATLEWMKIYEPWVPQKDIHFQENSEMPGNYFKAFMINKLAGGIYFEDSLDHAQTVLDYTDAIVVCLSDKMNLDNMGYKNLVRIASAGGNMPNLLPFYDWISRFDS